LGYSVKLLDLGRHSKARIWFDDSAVPAYVQDTEIVRVVAAKPGSIRESRAAAIELFVPLGGRFLYGMLGGRFTPDSSQYLSVAASVTSSEQPAFTRSLAENLDQVRVGLPAPYAEAIIEVIADMQPALTLASGHLALNRAAHGDIGSSSLVFEHLVIALMKLFNIDSSEPQNAELLRIFPERYDSIRAASR